jgi:hypothetical protein
MSVEVHSAYTDAISLLLASGSRNCWHHQKAHLLRRVCADEASQRGARRRRSWRNSRRTTTRSCLQLLRSRRLCSKQTQQKRRAPVPITNMALSVQCHSARLSLALLDKPITLASFFFFWLWNWLVKHSVGNCQLLACFNHLFYLGCFSGILNCTFAGQCTLQQDTRINGS